jgi:ribosomal protein L23
MLFDPYYYIKKIAPEYIKRNINTFTYNIIVDNKATKLDIKKSFKTIFDVNIKKVNIINIVKKKKIGIRKYKLIYKKKALISLDKELPLEIYLNKFVELTTREISDTQSQDLLEEKN